jgi:hypothetical protein
MRSISVSEIGLAVILISRSFTRIYQRRAVELYGIAGVRAAQTPGSGVIPTWVSLLTVVGWGATLLAVAGLIAD